MSMLNQRINAHFHESSCPEILSIRIFEINSSDPSSTQFSTF